MSDTSDAEVAGVPYENTAGEVWASRALDLHRHRQLQVQAFNTAGVVSAQIWGTCPRCGHDLNIQQTLNAPIIDITGHRGVWKALTRQSTPTDSGIPDTVEVGCGCGYSHPDAPGNLTGCGVSFRLPTAPPDDTAGTVS